MASSSSQKTRTRHFDMRWILVAVLLVSLLIAAIFINSRNQDADITKVTSALDIDNGDVDINWDRYENHEIKLSDTLSITKSGVYHLTGTLDNGYININAGVEGVVKLILDNVTIRHSSGPAISCTAGDDLVIELVGSNILEDGNIYSVDYDEDITGAIYSKADLTFIGNGSLDILANHQDGIVSKDDLKFSSGTYSIKSADDGIRGKDSVYVLNGNFTINAEANAIKTTNETDLGKGFVMIENGNFNLTAGNKGIKATRNITIYNGIFSIKSTDDAIHSDNYIGIVNGNININSGDDAIHANNTLVVDGGSITVAKSYEGLEAQVVTINNGNLKIASSDDGINAGGGNDSSAVNRANPGTFNTDENCILTINGGSIEINASGDGIDSNGWLYINGGTTLIDGPTNDGNGALDSGMGIIMNGGEMMAVGSNGMAESLGNNSAIYNISLYFNSVKPANTLIEIKSSTSDTVLSHTSLKSFSHLSAGTPAFRLGDSYTVYLNGEKYLDFTITGISTTLGDAPTDSRPPLTK